MALPEDDLGAYLDRIGYTGHREPTLAALRGIVLAHITTIPFENIDVLLGRGIRLDNASLMAKLVHGGRGGYCFEQNSLLLRSLQALGFLAEGLAARMIYGRPEADIGPRSHMLLRVVLPEGEFLADVGAGRIAPTVPMRFEIDREQATPHGLYRLVATDGEFELLVSLDAGWVRLYRFSLVPQLAIDYEVSNWFTSTHPAVLFTNHLVAARADSDRRFTLLDREFTTRHRDGRVERRSLADAADLAEVLRSCFRIAPSEAGRDAGAVWERLSVRRRAGERDGGGA
jgi:N-hydroxyarylamine O-acetyltransferase